MFPKKLQEHDPVVHDPLHPESEEDDPERSSVLSPSFPEQEQDEAKRGEGERD